eukprot:COSAG01_NODE_10145_length_2237_cov_2.528064_3_plen_109_part_00
MTEIYLCHACSCHGIEGGNGVPGFGARDLTPEAVRPLLAREASGLVHALLAAAARSAEVGQLGLVSRPVAGTRGRTLVVTLPGSPAAATEQLEALVALLPRVVTLLRQ